MAILHDMYCYTGGSGDWAAWYTLAAKQCDQGPKDPDVNFKTPRDHGFVSV